MANILVVDDERNVAELAQEHLAAFKHQATMIPS